jgi:Fe-S-cluster containining protein
MREVNCPKKCGECCKVIIMNDQNKALWRKNKRHWLLKNLKQIRRKDAEKIRPILKKVKWKGIRFYKCKAFNYKTNTCSIYTKRPYMCLAFPYYDKPSIDVRRMKALPNCYFVNQIMKSLV